MLRCASQLRQAFSNSGISAVRQQIDKLQTESAEVRAQLQWKHLEHSKCQRQSCFQALKILEAQLSEQFSGQMSAVELKQVGRYGFS